MLRPFIAAALVAATVLMLALAAWLIVGLLPVGIIA